MGFSDGSDGKEYACNAGDQGTIPDWEDPLEEGMETHSSILAWRIPMDKEAWKVSVHGVSQSWTRLSNEAQHIHTWKTESLCCKPETNTIL